ncbi:unnamed protein product [Adineta ricciae]|uniref:G-protein coupled receptors family 1 profile domain-containing protein n=1 Tax=Adineta ricciae TaxID=249248 RepID=A0A813PP69_ADIRI|nr:unnamed protein product [Adineta ricciae]CAF1222617.1 unnamed protein product [Adineta ricciae]
MSFSWQTIEFLSVCFAIILIILLTVGGNLVVLFAFCNDPHLLTPSNNFLLSMAIADLLVGLVGMPFYAYAQMKDSWPFGELFCKIWITIDDVVTMASVLSIVAITIERYWSINHSVHYRRHTTKTRIRLFSILIWLIPFLNFAPGIWLLKSTEQTSASILVDNDTNRTNYECIGAYHSHTVYLIMSQINFFAWPLVVIIVLNVLIVVNLYKRSHRFPGFVSFRVLQHRQPPPPSKRHRSSSLREQCRQKIEIEDVQQQQQQQLHQHPQKINHNPQITTVINGTNCYQTNKIDFEQNNINHVDERQSASRDISDVPNEDGSIELQELPSMELHTKQPKNFYFRIRQAFLSNGTSTITPPSERRSSKSTQTLCLKSKTKSKPRDNSITVWRHNSVNIPLSELPNTAANNLATTGAGEQRTVRRLRRDKRAATSLFTLVLVFMIFLLPYVFVVVVGRIFSLEILTDTRGQVYSASFWLLWLNSTINPILYPFIQPRFREAYRKLFVRFTRRQRRLAALIVDIQRGK